MRKLKSKELEKFLETLRSTEIDFSVIKCKIKYMYSYLVDAEFTYDADNLLKDYTLIFCIDNTHIYVNSRRNHIRSLNNLIELVNKYPFNPFELDDKNIVRFNEDVIIPEDLEDLFFSFAENYDRNKHLLIRNMKTITNGGY